MKNDNYTYMSGNCQGNAGTEIVQQAPSYPGGQAGGVPNGPFPYQSGMQPQVTVLPANSLGMLFDIGYQRGLNDSYWKEWFKIWRQMNRRPPPKKGSCRVTAENNKRIMFSRFMSNGTSNCMQFIMNCTGPIEIIPVETPGFQMKNKYLLVVFVNNGISVSVDTKKASNRAYLYDRFRQAGVEFNLQLSEADLKEGLSDLFRTQVVRMPVPINVFAGWTSAAEND